jgi:hypothetical protein
MNKIIIFILLSAICTNNALAQRIVINNDSLRIHFQSEKEKYWMKNMPFNK